MRKKTVKKMKVPELTGIETICKADPIGCGCVSIYVRDSESKGPVMCLQNTNTISKLKGDRIFIPTFENMQVSDIVLLLKETARLHKNIQTRPISVESTIEKLSRKTKIDIWRVTFNPKSTKSIECPGVLFIPDKRLPLNTFFITPEDSDYFGVLPIYMWEDNFRGRVSGMGIFRTDACVVIEA